MKKQSRKLDQKKESQSRFFKLLSKGTEALHQGDLTKATRFLERAYRLDRENIDAALNLGGAYILSRRFAEAVQVLEPLSRRDPDNPMVWTNLGAAYLGNPILAKDNDQQQAIAAFKKAIELNPAAPNVAYNLGLIYRDRQEIDQALHWFRRALQVNPNDRDARRFVEQLSEQGDEAN